MRWVWVACLSVCLSLAMACGEPGNDGQQGPQGERGEDGEQGPPGMDSSADEVANNLADSESFREQLAELIKSDPAFVESLRGETGPEGPAGPQGEAGPQGQQGPQGPAGDVTPADIVALLVLDEDFRADVAELLASDHGEALRGAEGPQGPIGPQGEQGLQGPQGEPGTDGAPGAPGQDGTSCTVSEEDSIITLQCEDGTSVAFRNPNTSPVCAVGSPHTCQGGDVVRCNDTGTGFELVQDCGGDGCAQGQCDPCFDEADVVIDLNPLFELGPNNTCELNGALRMDGSAAGIARSSGSPLGTIRCRQGCLERSEDELIELEPGAEVFITSCVAVDFEQTENMNGVRLSIQEAESVCGDSGLLGCEGCIYEVIGGDSLESLEVLTSSIEYSRVGGTVDLTFNEPVDARYLGVCRGGYGDARFNLSVGYIAAMRCGL